MTCCRLLLLCACLGIDFMLSHFMKLAKSSLGELRVCNLLYHILAFDMLWDCFDSALHICWLPFFLKHASTHFMQNFPATLRAWRLHRRHKVAWAHVPSDEIILIIFDARKCNVRRCPAAGHIQPHGDVGQCAALHFLNSAGVSHPHRVEGNVAVPRYLFADPLNTQALPRLRQHLHAAALEVVVLDGCAHTVDKVVFFLDVRR